MPQVDDSRMLVTTTPGSPSHWAHKVYESAEKSDQWRLSTTLGPSPWWSTEDLDAVKADLADAEYGRRILCRWAEADDQLTTAHDVAACVTHEGPLEPKTGTRYVMSLDLGLRHDRTVLVVAHLEQRSAGRTVVIDLVLRWRGTVLRPVNLSAVEAAIRSGWSRYHRPPLVVDPWNAAMLVERLQSTGMRVTEYVFSPSSIDRLARVMLVAFRDRTLALPDDPDLIEELAALRLVEVRPGVVRLDHTRSGHNDQGRAIGVAATHLLDHAVPKRAHLRSAAGHRIAVGPGPEFLGPREVHDVSRRGH